MNGYTKTYFKNLDAPRFLAFITVFFEHIIFTRNPVIKGSSLFQFYNAHLNNGIIGWDFYIVLSGFLITWIILEEYKFTSKFSLFYFWLRRCLRIWPLYFLMIIIAFSMVWEMRHFLHKNVNDVPPLSWLLSFTLNFYIIKHGQNFLFFLVFFWSISVEEQFYVIWGILMKWLKKALVPFCLLLIIASLIFRILALNYSPDLYFNSLSWVGNFASGALLANFCIRKGKIFESLIKCPKWIILLFYIFFIADLAFYKQIYSSGIMIVLERLSATAFFVFIIFEQSFCINHLFQVGKSRILSYLGRISYGLFCYHGLVILFYEKATNSLSFIDSPNFVFLINPLVIFVLTIAISAMSYEYFERPIMSLRHKLQTL